jgi:hypothetical protein
MANALYLRGLKLGMSVKAVKPKCRMPRLLRGPFIGACKTLHGRMCDGQID